MLVVKNTIVSDDIAECRFACDLACCKGQCCVDGDCGAPLLESEISDLERVLPEVLPYMTDEGRDVVQREGVWALDNVEEPCTPLVGNRECAFVAWGDDGTAYCAIEQAFRDGKIDYQKPVSCHLYPIRVDDYEEFTAVNYHRWDVCRHAVNNPDAQPLYIYLRDPLIRRFGQEWYDELLQQVKAKE